MPAPNPKEDTGLLVASLRQAGDIARRYYGGPCKSWNKSRGNPVTEADIEIDRYLKRTLLSERTDYGWLSEETEDDPDRLSRKRVFVVDPIDGTYGFLKHRPQFTIVAAVVENGRPVAAAIYNPITDEMFEAAQGQGAKKNGAAIHVSRRASFDGAKILAEKKLMESARWATPWPDSITAETRASAAYRIALVASGEWDITMSLTQKSDWDLAAGDLVVREAGGLITDRDAGLLIYNQKIPVHGSVICAGPQMHAQVLARLHEYRPA